MLREPIRLEEITFKEYSKRAERAGLLAKNERESPRYVYGAIDSAPTYASFYELLEDLQEFIKAGYVRLLHVPGKCYSQSEDEFEEGKDNPEYYKDLAERAEQEQALNVELLLISKLPKKKSLQKYRGNKLMFRKQERGIVYLAKAYFHKKDFEEMGVKSNIEREFHGVSVIYDSKD